MSYLNKMSDVTGRLMGSLRNQLVAVEFSPLRYPPSLLNVNVPVNPFGPVATVTCFRLRNAPMGFNTLVQPTLITDASPQRPGKSESAGKLATPIAHKPTSDSAATMIAGIASLSVR